MVTESDVAEIVQMLKSDAIGVDGIPLRFIKLILPFLLSPLTHLINHCITSSTFPLLWKEGRITPIGKTSYPSLPSHYRPISILSCLSKVLEKILAKQINLYLDENDLLSENQSGFRANRSCSTATVKVLDDIRSELDKDRLAVLCLLDFSKAFDRVNHDILCQKLAAYFGFSDRATRFINSYLSNRTQRVVIGEAISEPRSLLSGVPQGSILGPILFCMFINDLPRVCKNVSTNLYADDVQIYLSRPIGLIEDLVVRINEDLIKIHDWSETNGLSLNPGKTQAILLSYRECNTNNFPSIYIKDFKVPFSKSVTSLGFKVNTHLSSTDHINMTVGRIYGVLRKLWISRSFTPVETRLRLVKTLILPLITYSEVVYPRLDSASDHKLLVAFNNVTRYVYGLRRYDHISAFKTNILGCTLSQYISARNCIFLHKIIHTKSPRYLYTKLNFCQSARTLNIVVPTFKYLNSSRLFYVNSIRLWNSLPIQIKQIRGFTSFKNLIFKYFSSQR